MLSRYASVFLLLGLMVLLSACGGGDGAASDGDSDTAETVDSEESSDGDQAADGDGESAAENELEAEDVETEAGEQPDGDYSEGDDDSSELPDPDTVELRGVCPQDERYGFFEIQNGVDFGSISGRVSAGVVPQSVQDEILSEGSCKLLKKRNLFCDPPCDSLHTCDVDGQCIEFPRNQDAGLIRIEGLPAAVSMSALPPGNNYAFNNVSNPPFEAGVCIRLSGDGNGAVGALLMHGVGVETLLPQDEQWLLERDADLHISWNAAAVGARSQVLAVMSVDQHGSSPLTLRCELEDSGSADIPAAMVNALLDAGISGFPNGRLLRLTADSMELSGGGCVELLVTSPREMKVRVKGYIPCDKPADCPEDQTCNMVSHLCE